MSVVPEFAAVVVDFLVPSLAVGHLWCAAVVEGLGSVVIVVFLSLYFLC